MAVDVVRHLLPDGVVFIMTTASLVTNALVVGRLRSGKQSSQGKKNGDETSQQEEAGDPETCEDGRYMYLCVFIFSCLC